jgi:hypothetical protein
MRLKTIVPLSHDGRQLSGYGQLICRLSPVNTVPRQLNQATGAIAT